jgi:hypothetical protein
VRPAAAILACALLVLSTGPALAADPKAEFFANRVKPLLALCVDCHAGAEAEGGLDLTTRAGALQGGKSGPALRPGDGASLLLSKVAAQKMPPKKPLSPDQLADLRRWVADGAPWEGNIRPGETTTPTRAGLDWWSLQPVKRPVVPTVKNAGWVRTPVDAFILSRLEQEGLKPTAEADRALLLRRATFDLHGLPPTPEEIDAFVNDKAPDAWDKVIERLLASPRYGERWARHWLDVARFGESNGFEYDRIRENAWPYRDYVIRAFNQDKPYALFVKEQLAGDVLGTPDGVIASGFLVACPYDDVGAGAASPGVRARAREEELEELIGTVSQTFLGLTLNCARCHAHKFDPLAHADYYRVRAIFDGIHPGNRSALSAEQQRTLTAEADRKQQSLLDLQQKLARLEETARARVPRPGQTPVEGVPVPSARWTFARDASDERGHLSGTLESGAVVRGGRLILDGKGAFVRTAPLDRPLTARTFEAWVMLADLNQRGGGVISLETTEGRVFDALVYGEREPRHWVAGSNFFERTRDLGGAVETARPGELVHVAATYGHDGRIAFYRNGVPYGTAYTPATKPITYPAGGARILLGKRHTGGGNAYFSGEIGEARLYDRALSAEEVASSFKAGPRSIPLTDVLKAMTDEERQQHVRLSADLARALASQPAVPPSQQVYAIVPRQPGPTRLLLRGDPDQPREVVSPGGLSALRNLPVLELPADAPEGERRRRFAEWVVHPDNPLTARVLVNRVWQGHFGRGLVGTPNDFGFNGERPSHPELLDWLAAEFVAEGGSVKQLHRLLLRSAVYRQGSAFQAEAGQRDAEGRLWWRFPPRRLEGEVVRDSMLSVSGPLTESGGGPGFRPFTVRTFGSNFYDLTDTLGPEFNRRTIYRIAVHSAKDPLLDALDCPDPATKTPRRGVTTTPQQALGLMNNAFVWRQADALAARVRKEAGDDTVVQTRRAFRLLLGRPPRSDEAGPALDLVKEHGLRHLCWVLLNSSEFLYLR